MQRFSEGGIMNYDDLLDMYNKDDYQYEFDSDVIYYVNKIVIPKSEIQAESFEAYIDSFDFDEITTCEHDCEFSRYEIETIGNNVVLSVIYELTDDGVKDYSREMKRDNQWYLMNI
jgi:hypothetical protein